MPVYLIDTENVHGSWPDILYCAKPEDTIYVFYTDKSPRIHIGSQEILSNCRARIEYVACDKTSETGDNALDFQLVSMLGYLIAMSVNQGRLDVYFIVSCDGGFDAVVKFWRRNNILIQRLVTEQNGPQKMKPGPMVTLEDPAWNTPVAIKPNFSRIVEYANVFAKYLYRTIYYDFRFEIAEVFTDLYDRNLPADKFALLFQNEMSKRYGISNGLYAKLKPAFKTISENLLAELVKKSAPVVPTVVAVNAEKFEHPETASAPAPAAKSAAPKPAARPVPDVKKFNVLFHSSTQIQALENSIKKQLSAPLKSCAHDIIMAMMVSFDPDIEVWRDNYKAELKARCFDIKSLPGLASTIMPSSWSKADRAKLTGVFAGVK